MYLYLFIAKVPIRYINFYANIERYIYIYFYYYYIIPPASPFLTTRGCNIVVYTRSFMHLLVETLGVGK